MPHVKATFEIRNDRIDRHDDERKENRVLVEEENRRTITLERELRDVEDAVWALEAKDHEIVHDMWSDVKDDPEFEGYKTYPYVPGAEVSVSLDYEVHMHHVVHHVAARDGVDPLGVYFSPPGLWNRRFDPNTVEGRRDAQSHVLSLLSAYLAYLGHDTSDWTHGHTPDGKGSLKRVREAVEMVDRDD